jgi:hypothetical protein
LPIVVCAAIERAGATCYALPDGATVRMDSHTCCEPDALVAPLPKPFARGSEPGGCRGGPVAFRQTAKVTNYGRVPTILHYLIFDSGDGLILHHTKATMTFGAEPQRVIELTPRLDPPGIKVAVVDIFGAL